MQETGMTKKNVFNKDKTPDSINHNNFNQIIDRSISSRGQVFVMK